MKTTPPERAASPRNLYNFELEELVGASSAEAEEIEVMAEIYFSDFVTEIRSKLLQITSYFILRSLFSLFYFHF